MIKRSTILVMQIMVIISFLGVTSSIPEEGMYPLSEIHKVDLVKARIKN